MESIVYLPKFQFYENWIFTKPDLHGLSLYQLLFINENGGSIFKVIHVCQQEWVLWPFNIALNFSLNPQLSFLPLHCPLVRCLSLGISGLLSSLICSKWFWILCYGSTAQWRSNISLIQGSAQCYSTLKWGQ